MLFLKFGKKEHLQQLKEGVVHFRPLSSFIKDGTRFRGDRLEGHLLLDLSYPLLINGIDFAPDFKEVFLSYVGLESVLSFSVAKVDGSNCHVTENGLFTPNDDFIEEMIQFGSHFLIFPADEFIPAVNEELRKHKCNYEYHPIFYCDKTNHAGIAEYFEMKRNRGELSEPYDYCFIKDRTPYSKQNEWRIIVDDINNEFQIGDNGGVNIQTTFRTEMPIFETTLLNTLLVSEAYLK